MYRETAVLFQLKIRGASEYKKCTHAETIGEERQAVVLAEWGGGNGANFNYNKKLGFSTLLLYLYTV
jgi:hypothetical protein